MTFLSMSVLLAGTWGVAPVQRRCAGREPDELPAVVGSDDAKLVLSEFVYALEDRATPECHASTLAESHGTLVAAWFGGKHEKADDVGIWVSRKLSTGWTRPTEVENGVQSEQVRYPCWNPVLFQPSAGPLMLFYKVGPSPSAWWGMLATSRDGGKTWSEPRKLGRDPAVGHLLGPVKNKPIQLSDGTILCPSSTEHRGWRVHFERTDDLGKSWQVVGPIHDGRTFAAIQPTLLQHENGRLQALCRSKQQVIVQTWSRDQGLTWSTPAPTSLPNPNSGIDGLTLADGRHLLVYNHTVRGGPFPSGRQMLNVAMSSDGTRWRPFVTLERLKGEYSYPAVIQTRDGRIHISYTYRRQTVKHVVLRVPALAIKAEETP